MDKNFLHKLFQAHRACTPCPTPAEVTAFFADLLGALFADFRRLTFDREEDLEHHIQSLEKKLAGILEHTRNPGSWNAGDVARQFFHALPALYEKINQDINAMFEGDPAAKSRSEVIRTYPGFYAIAAYRIAHQLHLLGVPEIPRMLTEQAHGKTGIDIHPAARIGDHFCIDHGTGIVIGETAWIGEHVKLYQGVTLGALSVSKADAERKRHPTLEDRVVVYAGATILGGETIIGHDSVIGGNVWLTRSVPPHSKIYYQSKMYHDDGEHTDILIFKSER